MNKRASLPKNRSLGMDKVDGRSLHRLYDTHKGKVSDKWSIYLDEYERIFSTYRNRPVRILEIGIQNGGSLEIWGKYFPRAKIILGCDIDKKCGLLTFRNRKISVVVGDAGSESIEKKILERSDGFDIVIDDGSHKSSDVIRAFARYFPHLSDGGVFVAEDLHTSYWKEFEGGLYDPLSSMSFFKRLLDLVNHEHWGLDRSRTDALATFADRYGVAFDESSLASIHSIEFLNSLCVVTKRTFRQNVLGHRHISGKVAAVEQSILPLQNIEMNAVSQAENPWSLRSTTIEEQIGFNRELIERRDARINELSTEIALARTAIRERDAWFAQAQSELGLLAEEHTAEIEYNTSRLADLEHQILALERERQALQSTIAEIYRSTSWRASGPIRFIKQSISSLGRLVLGQGGWHSNSGKERQPEAGNDIQEVHYAAQADCPAFVALSRLPEQQAARGAEIGKDDAKLIAFYLPQYHRIPENSEWWGDGFTEWTNVARAKPNFEGHHQPHIPRDLGYYDLSHPDTMREQAELAKLYGVHGFCFYHYWFSGRRILQKPVNNFLDSDIDINFCLCWANENWTRTWDGNSKSILLEQLYADGDAEAFIDSLIDIFRDRRYINIGGKPLLVVYRAKDIPDPKRWFKIWRERVQDRGFPGLHIAVVDFYDISTPDEVGADSLVEFPPHKFNGPQSHPSVFPTITNPDFAGGIVDYAKVIAQSANRSAPSFKLFRGIMPGWDNTARRQNTPTIVVNACPELYGAWLGYLRDFTRRTTSDASERLIFINAWNEWGEGCYLEPDQRWGHAYLEQTLKSAYFEIGSASAHSLESERVRLLTKTSEVVVSGNLNCKLPVFETASQSRTAMVENVAAELSAYRPPGDFARRISAALVRWPLLHTIAKKGYTSLQRFRG